MKLTDDKSAAILSHLAQGTEYTFSALEKTGINSKSLSIRLQLLREKKLINKDGRNYIISDKGRILLQSMKHLRSILEPSFPDYTNLKSKIPNDSLRFALARYVYLLIEFYKKKLDCVLLFGSVAKGTMTDTSDIDLLIIVKDWNISLWDRTAELLSIRRFMRTTPEYKALQVHQKPFRVQHIPFSRKEALKSHAIYPDLLVDHIILYQNDNKANNLLKWIRAKCEKIGLRKVTKLDKTTYWITTGGNPW